MLLLITLLPPQATVVTDTVSLYLLKKGPFYRKKKYQQVEDTTKTSDIQDQDLDDNQSETDSVKVNQYYNLPIKSVRV